jgi:hypothetical protein
VCSTEKGIITKRGGERWDILVQKGEKEKGNEE